MHTLSAVAGLTASLGFFVSSSSATVLIHEPFTYISGDLDAVSGSVWTPVSSPGNSPPQVINGVLKGMDAGNVAMEDNAVPFGATATLLFYGLDVSFTGTALPTGNAYFAAFRNGVTEVGRLFLGAPAGGAANSYRLGIGQTITGDGGGAVNFLSNLTFGTVYRIVIGYDPASGFMDFWLANPDPTNPQLSLLAGSTTQIDSFVLRQGGNAANTYSGLNIDNLTIATTFSEANVAVPEPATWLMMIGGAGLLVAMNSLRRRR